MKLLKNLFKVIFFKAAEYKFFYFPVSRFLYLLFLLKNKNSKKKKNQYFIT